MTLRSRLVAALVARGYVVALEPASSYTVLSPTEPEGSLVRPRSDGTVPPHRVLVGATGHLWYTTSTVAARVELDERYLDLLLGPR